MCAYLSECYDSFCQSQFFLDSLDGVYFPFDPFQLVKLASQDKKILIATKKQYLDFATTSNATKKVININDAKCIYDPNSQIYLIIYNEKIYPYQRIRFSIAHELAHIILGHLNDRTTEMNRGGISSEAYCQCEKEANTFAGNLIAPPILINKIIKGKSFKSNLIASIFGLSNPAVESYRKSDYWKWLSLKSTLECEENILNKYETYIYQRLCGYCGHISYGENKTYCEICGKQTKVFYGSKDYLKVDRKDINMKYEKARLLECPNCENEEILSKSKYCHICGNSTENKCSNDCDLSKENPFPSNARYCPYCGEESSFEKQGVLENWREEHSRKEEDLPF